MQEHQQQILRAVTAVSKYPIRNFYFVACGGSLAVLMPGQYLIEQETEFPAFAYSSAEFTQRNPKALGPGSVVILCSTSGNTPETVAAAKFAREKGALTIGFSHLVDSPLWQEAEYRIHYSTGDEAEVNEYSNALLYRLLFAILDELQPDPKYKKMIYGILEVYPRNLKQTLEKYKEWAEDLGKAWKREPIIYTMSSGITYPVAYSFAICILMEMQWIHSQALHSGEFFHGPFEITDFDVPMIILKNIENDGRLEARAIAFTQKFSDKITVVDTSEFCYDGIEEDLKKYFAPLIAAPVLRLFATELAEQRGHPLSVRRYMWKMKY